MLSNHCLQNFAGETSIYRSSINSAELSKNGQPYSRLSNLRRHSDEKPRICLKPWSNEQEREITSLNQCLTSPLGNGHMSLFSNYKQGSHLPYRGSRIQ